VALALVASVATVTYAASMQEQRFRYGHEGMSEEECEEIMGQMHNSDYHGSMMNNNYNGMMHGSETSNSGCPGH